MYHTYGRIIV